jgi:hypothetical protein
MAESVMVTNYKELQQITLQNKWADKDQVWLPINNTFCMYATPRITGTGDKLWHTAATVVSFALLIWGIYEQLRIFNMRYDIAKAYANIASDQWVRFTQRYLPLENAMVQYEMDRGPVKPDYETARIRNKAFADHAWGAATGLYQRLQGKYFICPDKRSNSWNTAQGQSNDDVVNFGYREEEASAQNRDDLRWNQRAALLNLGRGNAALGQQYAAVADKLLAPLGEGAAQVTNGAMYTIGYLYDRNMLSFPGFFTQSTNPGQITGMENIVLGKAGKDGK